MAGVIKKNIEKYLGYGHNERGFALVATLAVTMIVTTMGLGYYMKNSMEVDAVIRDVEQAQTFYVAEAGLNWGMKRLKDISSSTKTVGSDWLEPVEVNGGTAYVAFARKDVGGGYFSNRMGFLHATTINEITTEQERTLVVEVVLAWNVPISTATLVGPNAVNGNFTIDGRDHQLAVAGEAMNGWSPQVISNNGSLGIITDAGSFNRGGAAEIGGSRETLMTDVVPTTTWAGANGWNQIVDLNRADLPTNPDEVMKFADGYMRQYALDNGTLYTNSHPHSLTASDGQIIYYEFDSNNNVTFNGLDLQMDSPGSTAIVVIHNKGNGDTTLKLMNGTFKGVLVADQFDKIHGEVVGALFSVGATRRSLGNGSGGIYYSSAVVAQMIDKYEDAWDEGEILSFVVFNWDEDNSLDAYRGVLRDGGDGYAGN